MGLFRRAKGGNFPAVSFKAQVESCETIGAEKPEIRVYYGYTWELDSLEKIVAYSDLSTAYRGIQYFAAKLEPGTGAVGCQISIKNCKAKVKFKEFYLNASERQYVYDCVNFGNTAQADFNENGKSWYKLCKNPDIFIGEEKTKIYKEDWILSLENCARDPNEYILWSNNLKEARLGNAATKIVLCSESNRTEKLLREIEFAQVSENGTRTNIEYLQFGVGNEFIKAYIAMSVDSEKKVCYTDYDEKYRAVKSEDSLGNVTVYEYDDFGNTVLEKLTDPHGNFVERRSSYGIEGKNLLEESEHISPSLRLLSYSYDQTSGNLVKTKDAGILNTQYEYDTNNQYLTKIAYLAEGTSCANELSYDRDLIKTLKHNDLSYEFTAGADKRLVQVQEAGSPLVNLSYIYTAPYETVRKTYPSKAYESAEYDRYSRPIIQNGIRKDFYTSEPLNLLQLTDPKDSSLKSTSSDKLVKRIDSNVQSYYAYDKYARKKQEIRSNGTQSEYIYDEDNRLKENSVTVNGEKHVVSYTYENGDAFNCDRVKTVKTRISKNEIEKNVLQTTDTYDSLSRLTKRAKNGITETYSYHTYGEGGKGATACVKNGVYNIGSRAETDSFEYDIRGHITKITSNGRQSDYVYDAFGRLVRENNQSLNVSWTYEYDAGGNITFKKRYAYSVGSLGTPVETIPYAYDAVKRDRLKSWNHKSITYDADGNPLDYKGIELEWEKGRRLSVYTDNSNAQYIYFYYDEEGNRICKINYGNGGATYYEYLDGRLVSQEQNNDILNFLYDQSGIAGFSYDNKLYLYRKNTQGDVISVYSGTEEKARYAYDAWGNCKIEKNVNNIATLNPIRYRSYYYDENSKLYYLKSRYYDPETGRFLNADDISYVDPETIYGLNLYAYCQNNPVMMIDSAGTSALPWWGKLLIGIGVVLVGAVVTALTAGTGAGFMAAFGAAMLTSAKAVAISTAISAGIGLAMGGIITGTWEGALNGLLDGVVDGFMWGGIFAGGAQILSGGFKVLAQVGANTSKSGFFKLLTPNRLRDANEIAKIGAKGQKYYEYGGTMLKVGRNFIDVSNKTLLHMHLWFSGGAHIPLGTILGGLTGGFQ